MLIAQQRNPGGRNAWTASAAGKPLDQDHAGLGEQIYRFGRS